MMDLWKEPHKASLGRSVNLQKGMDCDDLLYMHPNMLILLGFVSGFCKQNDIDLVLTSMIRSPQRDQQLGANSKTHQQGRAIDFSIKEKHGWSYELVQKLVDVVNSEMSYLGAISASDGRARPIVVHKNHDGVGSHAHLQVRP